MSVAEMKTEILKLSPDDLNQLWDAIEDALDKVEADEALRRNDFESWDQVKARLV